MNDRVAFFIVKGEMGKGGLCYERKVPKGQDPEVFALRELEHAFRVDRVAIHVRGEHPLWLRPSGERFQLPPEEPTELWGYASG